MRWEELATIRELGPIKSDFIEDHIDEYHRNASFQRGRIRTIRVVRDDGSFNDESSHTSRYTATDEFWARHPVDNKKSDHTTTEGKGNPGTKEEKLLLSAIT